MENNLEEEVSDGVFIRKRDFIINGLSSLGLIGLSPLLTGNKAFAQEANLILNVEGQISFEQFLLKANPLTQNLIKDTSTGGQDQYLHSLAALASRIEKVPEPVSWNDSTQSDKPGTFIGFNPGGEVFTILQWRMEPNTKIRLHRHDYGNVVTVGLSGDTHVENYEIVSENHDYIPRNTVQVRKTIDQQLTAGNINIVSLNRNYIHGFVAGPEGASGLDITTRIRAKPAHSTPYLEVNSKPVDEFKHIYQAEWVE